MKKKIKTVLVILIIDLILTSSIIAQNSMEGCVFSGGAGKLSNSQFQTVGILGQPFIGCINNTVHVNNTGFIYIQYQITEPTDAEKIDSELPSSYRLEQNYPNPFNPSTTISFSIPERVYVTLKVFDVLGNEVADLISKELSAGKYNVKWNAENISSGVYFYRIQTCIFFKTKKLILLR